MMNQKNDKKGLRLCDWKLWFRLGTIGFLLLLSSRVNSQELRKLPAPPALQKQVAETDENATLKIKAEKKKKSLPVLIAPSEQKKNNPKKKSLAVKKNPAEVAPMPVITPQRKTKSPLKRKVIKKPVSTNSAEKTSKKKVTQADSNTEQWSMLITPGVSSHPNVKSKASVAVFQLDRKTKRMVAPPVHHELGYAKKTARKKEAGTLKMVDPNQPTSSVDESLPVLQPKKKPVKAGDYEQIYNSIPYSRAEYLANPAYRHEATMEILFGTLRPTVIHKQDKPKRVYNQPRINQATPRTSPPPMPFGYGGYGGYGYGYYPGYYGGYYGGYGGYYRGYNGGYYGGYGYRGGYRPYSALNTYGHTRYGYRSNRYGNRYSH